MVDFLPGAPELGLVGKPNVGKSTFFAAATLMDVKIASYPFTTIEPNRGVAYVKFKCVCEEFGVQDQPRNSFCVRGWRFAPVELIDVAGLVPGAWQGRGLGNRFLDAVRRAKILIHVVDASGSTDIEGRPVKPGTHDPIEDIEFLENEIDMWIFQILKKDWNKTAKLMSLTGSDPVKELSKRLSGLEIDPRSIERALQRAGLAAKKAANWKDKDLLAFIKEVRRLSKPIVIAANKIDVDPAPENVERMKKEFEGRYIIVPTSAEAELALRRASAAGLIDYIPGSSEFKMLKELSERQRAALRYIEEKVLEHWGSTGVQEVINKAVFDAGHFIAVFPVENEAKLTDHEGRVLPDVFLLPEGSTAKDLAYAIHTELGEKFIAAIDARTKRKLSGDYTLKHRDVIKIVTSR